MDRSNLIVMKEHCSFSCRETLFPDKTKAKLCLKRLLMKKSHTEENPNCLVRGILVSVGSAHTKKEGKNKSSQIFSFLKDE